MSNETKSDKTQATSDGFVEVKLDRPSIKFENFTTRDEKNPKRELYTGTPIQGKLLAALDLGDQPADDDGEIKKRIAYVVQLETPATAFDRAGQPVKLAAGDEALLWPNAMLDQAISVAAGVSAVEAASHPTHAIRVKITPLYREPTPKDPSRRMWHFKVAAHPEPAKRVGSAFNVLSGIAAKELTG